MPRSILLQRDTFAYRLAADEDHLTLYHGTNKDYLDSIKSNGLRASGTSTWPILTDSFNQASTYAKGHSGNNPSKAAVLEYHIPHDKVYQRGNKTALLWPGISHNVYDSNATAYALRQDLPNDYVAQIHDVGGI